MARKKQVDLEGVPPGLRDACIRELILIQEEPEDLTWRSCDPREMAERWLNHQTDCEVQEDRWTRLCWWMEVGAHLEGLLAGVIPAGSAFPPPPEASDNAPPHYLEVPLPVCAWALQRGARQVRGRVWRRRG